MTHVSLILSHHHLPPWSRWPVVAVFAGKQNTIIDYRLTWNSNIHRPILSKFRPNSNISSSIRPPPPATMARVVGGGLNSPQKQVKQPKLKIYASTAEHKEEQHKTWLYTVPKVLWFDRRDGRGWYIPRPRRTAGSWGIPAMVSSGSKHTHEVERLELGDVKRARRKMVVRCCLYSPEELAAPVAGVNGETAGKQGSKCCRSSGVYWLTPGKRVGWWSHEQKGRNPLSEAS